MTAFPGSSDQNGPLIALTQEPCVDERGEIRNLLDVPFTSVAVITSVKGAVRGNHYHKTDYHYCWLQRGGLIYAHRPVGATAPPQCWVIKPGQIFFTPPQYEHVMVFTDESVMFAFAHVMLWAKVWQLSTCRVSPTS